MPRAPQGFPETVAGEYALRHGEAGWLRDRIHGQSTLGRQPGAVGVCCQTPDDQDPTTAKRHCPTDTEWMLAGGPSVRP